MTDHLPQTLSGNIEEYLRIRDGIREARNPRTGRTAIYLHAGQIELQLTDPVSIDALTKLRDFVDTLIKSGKYA